VLDPNTATSAEPASAERPAPALAHPPEGSGRDIRARTPYVIRMLASSDSHRKVARVLVLLSLDLLGLFLSIWSALAVKDVILGEFSFSATTSLAGHYLPFAFLITMLLFARAGLYGAREGRHGPAGVIVALFQAAVISLIFALISGDHYSSYWLFYGSFLFACVFVGALRYLYENVAGRMLTSLGFCCRVMLIGSDHRALAVAQALKDDASARRHEIVGYLSLDGSGDMDGLRNLGHIDQLRSRIVEHAVEEVIITDPEFPQDQAVELIDDCQSRGVRVRVAPSTMELLTHRMELVPGEGLPLFEVKPPAFEGLEFVVKRTFDFVGGIVLLILLSPLLLIAALAVKLTSRGPILHSSPRPGLGGRPFKCLKFRTMTQDAELRQAEFESLNESSGALFKIRDDPRLTPVGGFLRRNSIDELPQLLNVLRGDMSLVGPRPLPLRDHARLDDWHRRRYLVLPGITGLWQVSGRSDLDFDDMVRLDFLYLERWSVLLDLVILVRTLPAVIRRRGAY
jgi:exopolysaccharide biosynthesis polyprenyl glycosylphosphotransferase